MNKYGGGCHCRKVRYEVQMDLNNLISCNCSMCSKKGTILGFVGEKQFSLLSGRDALSDYQFNKKQIHHLFCSNCGVTSFASGTDASGAPIYAINVRCLDEVDVSKLPVTQVDGKSF